MDIEIKSNEAPGEKQPIQPPADFTSRGSKTKLLVLVGTLMFVLVMMNEARKPENWQWMGFDKQGKQLKQEEQKKFIIKESQYEPRETSDSEKSPEDSKNNENSESQLDTEVNSDGVIEPPINATNDDRVSIAEPEFWKLLYRQLDLSDQRALFSSLRGLRARSFRNENDVKKSRFVLQMDDLVKGHLTELLNDLSLIDTGNPKRSVLNTRIRGLQTQWQQHLLPVLSGEPITDESQRQTVHALQAVLDEAAYAAVKDKSAPTWASDDPAWLRTWERVFVDSKDWQADEVKPIQLKAEPDFYRGKPVAIRGELRGIEVLPTKNNPMGVERYYSLWIRPDVSAVHPFNVYVAELPEGLELSETRFTPFNGRQVSLIGAFFKVRTYEDAGGTISEAPLIFSKSFEILEADQGESTQLPVRGDWKPSQGMLIGFFVGMPLLAFAIAFIVYRGTMSRRILAGAAMSSKINQTLEELEDNPHVETVQEKLMKMESQG